MLSDITSKYYKHTTLEHRKKYGQYMTPYDIINESLKLIDIKKYKKILEPSCGTGQFIEKIKEINNKASITGIELDKKIYDNIHKNFDKKVQIINDDFLLYDFEDKQYDLIIGNPPYFEIEKNNETYKDVIKSYKKSLCGRINIYTLFIHKSIELLKIDGVLLFVIPTSLLSSKYFENIRFYIENNCNILNIKILNSNDFEDALQQTMIFVIQKIDNKISKNNGKFIIKLGDTIVFNNKYEEFNEIIKNKKFIKDYNCTVKTGSVVWNQNKESLTNESKNNIILVYPRNLDSNENKLVLSSHDTKKQYLDLKKYKKDPIKSPLIAINRIIGIKDISLKPVLFTDKEKYYFENHINIICGELENLKIIYDSLKNPKTIEFIRNIIGNTQLSKTELESMIPIFVSTKQQEEKPKKKILNKKKT